MNAKQLGEKLGYIIGKIVIISCTFLIGKKFGRKKRMEDELRQLPPSKQNNIPPGM